MGNTCIPVADYVKFKNKIKSKIFKKKKKRNELSKETKKKKKNKALLLNERHCIYTYTKNLGNLVNRDRLLLIKSYF